MSKLACFSMNSAIAWSTKLFESSAANFYRYWFVTIEIMFSTLISPLSPVLCFIIWFLMRAT